MEKLIKKTPDISALVTTTVLNTKIGEVENNIPNFSGLVTTVILNTKIVDIENKIPDISSLVTTVVLNIKNWRSWEKNTRC